MSILWVDGFDHYGADAARLTDGVYADANECSLSTANPRTGTYHLRVQSIQNNSGPRRIFGGTRDTVGIGYAFYIPTLPSTSDDYALLQIKDSDNNNLSTLTVDTTGRLQYRRGNKEGTILGSSNPCVLAQSYQHVEIWTYTDNSHGWIEVRVNGVTRLNLTGLDNLPDGLGQPAQVRIGCDGFAKTGAPAYTDIDDLFAADDLDGVNDDFIGDKKAYTRFPDADGAENDWTPSTGMDAFAMLNNVPPDDASEYIYAVGNQTNNERQTVGIDDYPAEIVSIATVYTATRAWKTDAGNATIQAGVISSGSEDQGDVHALSTQPNWYGDVFQTDPNTASPWTLSGINAMLGSLERLE